VSGLAGRWPRHALIGMSGNSAGADSRYDAGSLTPL
jgi:hypothetical protein